MPGGEKNTVFLIGYFIFPKLCSCFVLRRNNFKKNTNYDFRKKQEMRKDQEIMLQ